MGPSAHSACVGDPRARGIGCVATATIRGALRRRTSGAGKDGCTASGGAGRRRRDVPATTLGRPVAGLKAAVFVKASFVRGRCRTLRRRSGDGCLEQACEYMYEICLHIDMRAHIHVYIHDCMRTHTPSHYIGTPMHGHIYRVASAHEWRMVVTEGLDLWRTYVTYVIGHRRMS